MSGWATRPKFEGKGLKNTDFPQNLLSRKHTRKSNNDLSEANTNSELILTGQQIDDPNPLSKQQIASGHV